MRGFAPRPKGRPRWGWRGFGVVVLIQLGAFLSSLPVESGPGSWYAELEKVPWTPPPAVFPPVWTALYLLMGIGFLLQWKAGFEAPVQRRALGLFFLQLLLNYSYTPVQFGLQWLTVQAVLILAVLAVASTWVLALRQIDWRAAVLQIPYLLWVAYAATVALGLWWLNR